MTQVNRIIRMITYSDSSAMAIDLLKKEKKACNCKTLCTFVKAMSVLQSWRFWYDPVPLHIPHLSVIGAKSFNKIILNVSVQHT